MQRVRLLHNRCLHRFLARTNRGWAITTDTIKPQGSDRFPCGFILKGEENEKESLLALCFQSTRKLLKMLEARYKVFVNKCKIFLRGLDNPAPLVYDEVKELALTRLEC